MRTANLAATTIVAALLVGAVPTAAAAPSIEEDDAGLVLAHDAIQVIIQDGTPRLMVQDPADSERTFTVVLQRIVEVPREAPAGMDREPLAVFDLAGADGWTVTTTQDEAGAHAALSREAPVRARTPDVPGLGGLTGNLSAGNATVNLTFHAYAAPHSVEVGEAVVQVASQRELAFELDVADWPWVDAERDVLALEFTLDPAPLQAEAQPEADGARARLDVPPAPDEDAEDADDVDRSESMEAAPMLGWFAWLTTAQAVGNGTSEAVQVLHEPRKQAEGDGTDAAGGEPDKAAMPEGATHWLVYDASGYERLHHTPSIGVAPQATGSVQGDDAGSSGSASDALRDVPGPSLALMALALAGAAGIAVAARRPDRRRGR